WERCRPQLSCAVVFLKYGAKQLLADLFHPALDASGDAGRGIERILKVIFQVPAQVFLVLRAQSKGKLGNSGMPGCVGFFKNEVDLVPALVYWAVGEAKCMHVPYLSTHVTRWR